MTSRVSRRGRHVANVGDVIIYADLVVARTVEQEKIKHNSHQTKSGNTAKVAFRNYSGVVV